jgi:hypothetical protein
MTVSEPHMRDRRSVAAVIHDLDNDRSKWGLTVLLVCANFWLVLFSVFQHFF